MKATAEVHTKPQQAADGELTSGVNTQQPILDAVHMDDITLQEDGVDGGMPNETLQCNNESIELKDMSVSKDDSGISVDVLTSDLGPTESPCDRVDTNIDTTEAGPLEPALEPALEPPSDVHLETVASVSSHPETLPFVHSDTGLVNNRTDAGTTELVLSVKLDDTHLRLTDTGTGSGARTSNDSARLDVEERASTCSLELDVPRELGDGRVDEASLVEVEVEVKDEMDLLSRAIAEVQSEDGKLFEAKMKYEKELREARLKLYRMYKTHRQAIEKTKPYYIARELEKEMKEDLEQIETDAERARLNFEAARETEAIAMEAMTTTKAEHGSIGSQGCEGKEAMENWNQATSRVLETSKCRAEIEDRLRRKEEQFLQAERSANSLFLDLKKFIDKAWPYYAMKDQYQKTLDNHKKAVRECGQRLASAKEKYKQTFSRLNLVATEIHQRKTINDRQSGIGANDNFSQFEEVHDIDSVLSELETRAENLSACVDGLDDEDEADLEAELTIMPKSRSLFSLGRSNTRESLDEIYDAGTIMREKGRRKTLSNLNL